MAIIAPTFDFMKVSPGDDAHLYDYLGFGGGIDPNYGTMFSVNTTGLTVNVESGMAIIKGRMVKNTSTYPVIVPANSKGWIVITIDLTKQNTFTGTPGDDNYKPVNNQVRIERVASLVQQDILNGGSIYMFPICEYTSTGSTVTLGPRLFESGSRKGSSVILYDGKAAFGKVVNLPSNVGQFEYLTISVGIFGGHSSIETFRKSATDGSFWDRTASGLNLYNDATSKGYELGECDITFSGKTVKISRAKILNSAGVITTDAGTGESFYINTIVGHY